MINTFHRNVQKRCFRTPLYFAFCILYFAFSCLAGCAPEQPLAPPLSPSLGFSDPALDEAVRQALLKSKHDVLLPSDVAGLQWLSTAGWDIQDLEGIQKLTALTQLDLSDNRIVSITPLAKLTSLTLLYLNNNEVRDISALSGLTSLVVLDVAGNQIQNISALSNLTSLGLLYANRNRIGDIAPLSGLIQLEIIRLSNNEIEDISPLSDLTMLNTLNLGSNRIEDISSLSGLTLLGYLNLSGNRIADISALVENGGIGTFDTVVLSGNPLNDQALSSHISTLEARRVTVMVKELGR